MPTERKGAWVPLSPEAGGIGQSFKGIVLLCGSVRADRFHSQVGRSLLNLPIDSSHTLLDQWEDQAAGVEQALGGKLSPVIAVFDRASSMPEMDEDTDPRRVRVERDPNDFRGTGGVLRDVALSRFDSSDYLLVANGAQVVIGTLADHFFALAHRGGDVVIVGHDDGTPSGLMLVRCGALEAVPRTGFVDMKEQALPRIASQYDVRVVRFERPTARPVRTHSDYIAALRIHHHQLEDRNADLDPFAENLHSSFSIVERGARVDDSARIHDSVVLRGATVEANAIVVRSVIGDGARAPRGHTMVDRIVGGVARSKIERAGE